MPMPILIDTTQSPRKQKKAFQVNMKRATTAQHVEGHHKAGGHPVGLVGLGVSSKHWHVAVCLRAPGQAGSCGRRLQRGATIG